MLPSKSSLGLLLQPNQGQRAFVVFSARNLDILPEIVLLSCTVLPLNLMALLLLSQRPPSLWYRQCSTRFAMYEDIPLSNVQITGLYQTFHLIMPIFQMLVSVKILRGAIVGCDEHPSRFLVGVAARNNRSHKLLEIFHLSPLLSVLLITLRSLP